MVTPSAQHETDTVGAARADARAQAGRVAEAMPYRPASSTPFPPAGVDADLLVWAETVAAGGYTHKVLARGSRIRLEDVTGEACAHVLLYNALEPWERLNVADTMKIPWQAYLRTGHPLLSGDGRVLATIVADDSAGTTRSAVPVPLPPIAPSTVIRRHRARRRPGVSCSSWPPPSTD